jgi:uncharacterized phiE125 gp8 family phage protein
MREVYEECKQEIISLSELKNYLKIDFDKQDDLLVGLIKTARESAEKILNRHITRKTITQVSVANNLQVIKLVHNSIIQINSITLVDTNKKNILLDKSEYYFDKSNSVCLVKFSFSYNKVTISYDVGYRENSMVPASLKTGMLTHIAAIYDNGALLESTPKITLDLYQPYRNLKF